MSFKTIQERRKKMLTSKKEKSCADLIQERWHDRRDELEKFDANGWDMFHEYGLDFSYVEPDTFDNQPKGYHRFQISWGGPSDELRFYTRGESLDNEESITDKVEYWFLDWFDGASIDVSDEEVIKNLWTDYLIH